MNLLDWLKILGGTGAVFGIIGVGLFGLSKLRNSKLRKQMEAIASEITNDKEQIHEIEVSVGKDEQHMTDINAQVTEIDKQIEKVDSTPPKKGTNEEIINLFDKLSKE